MSEKIVVIGAAAAGLRAAARAKRLMPGAEVIVLDAAEVISYGACGLPYFVSGDIQALRSLRTTIWGAMRDPEFFRTAKALDVRTGKLRYVPGMQQLRDIKAGPIERDQQGHLFQEVQEVVQVLAVNKSVQLPLMIAGHTGHIGIKGKAARFNIKV